MPAKATREQVLNWVGGEETMCLQHCRCYKNLSEDMKHLWQYNEYILKENRKLKEKKENK